MTRFRAQATPAMKGRFQGIIQTVWSDADSFLRDLENQRVNAQAKSGRKSAARCFIELFNAIQALKAGEAPASDKESQ